MVEYGNKNSITDAGVGTMNLDSGFRGARLNVLINLAGIKDEDWVAAKRETMDEMASEMAALVKEYDGHGRQADGGLRTNDQLPIPNS